MQTAFTYKLNIIEESNKLFITSISTHLKCPYCLKVLREPMRINCGHSFCKDCLEFLPTNCVCPADGKKYIKSLSGKDLIIDSYIKDLKTYCLMKDEGCNEVMKYETQYSHCEVDCKQYQAYKEQWNEEMKLKEEGYKIDEWDQVDDEEAIRKRCMLRITGVRTKKNYETDGTEIKGVKKYMKLKKSGVKKKKSGEININLLPKRRKLNNKLVKKQ